MNFIKNFILTVFLVIISGCVTVTGEKFTQLESVFEGKSKVYIYRTPGFQGSLLIPSIEINGKTIGDLPRGGYYAIDLDPGKITTRISKGEKNASAWLNKFELTQEFHIKENSTVFLRFAVTGSPIPLLAIISQDTSLGKEKAMLLKIKDEFAIQDLKKCKLISND